MQCPLFCSRNTHGKEEKSLLCGESIFDHWNGDEFDSQRSHTTLAMPLAESDYADELDNALFKLIKSQRWKAMKAMLETEEGKTMAKQPDKYGNMPLHAAIGFKAPDAQLLHLLEIAPDATKVHGTDYWLPLHVAAMFGASPQVMEKIILCNPDALDDMGEPGVKGRSPRHFSARFAHNREALELSTEEWKSRAADAIKE